MSKTTRIYKKASLWTRLFAYIIDSIIITALQIVIVLVGGEDFIFANVAYFIILILYGPLFLWQKGATPGKMLFKIKVFNDSYQPIGLGTALLRETIGKMISGIFYLGYLWMLLDKQNQAWHDKIAHTFVVPLDKAGDLIPTSANETITIKRKIAFSILILISILPTAFLFTYIFFYRPFQISSNAMYPNFKSGEYIMTQISRGPFERGDVIIMRSPTDANKDFIKRIIAVPGDTVLIHLGSVYVNNHPIDESQYLGIDIRTYGGTFLPDEKTITVPPNSYFVLGDNRSSSSDSREWGFVPQSNIISKPLFCYWQCEHTTK